MWFLSREVCIMTKWLWRIVLFFFSIFFVSVGGFLGGAVISILIELIKALSPSNADYIKALINVLSGLTIIGLIVFAIGFGGLQLIRYYKPSFHNSHKDPPDYMI